MLYVLDEPSIGLHPRDIQRLLGAICNCAAAAIQWWSSSTRRR